VFKTRLGLQFLRFATTRLAREERCFPSVFQGTSPHGGKLRGGAETSLLGISGREHRSTGTSPAVAALPLRAS